MGWYLRKSFKVGPLRVNLSKSGLGVSAGVKGARAGVDATGRPYVHAGRFGLYYRRYLKGDEPLPPETGQGLGTSRPAGRLLLILALALGVLLLLIALAEAADRVDLYDPQGRRTGYAIMDRESGWVGFYDALSRRTGWGRMDRRGKVERFGLDGTRQEETALPPSSSSLRERR